MEELKIKYNQIVSERQNVIEQINYLKENEFVKKYFDLVELNDKLVNQEKDLYNQIEFEKYSSCNHIWVKTLIESDWECRTHTYNGCVKCGLDQKVFYLMDYYNTLDLLPLEQRTMYNYMCNNSYNSGIKTNIICDFDLAKTIYAKIIENHPNIDDETSVEYMKAALHDIRNTKVSNERKENRAKRLSLKPNYGKWTEFHVRK